MDLSSSGTCILLSDIVGHIQKLASYPFLRPDEVLATFCKCLWYLYPIPVEVKVDFVF
jgi:hypothetical protein